MIRGVIIVNNHGKPRLVKFYQTVVSRQQFTLIRVSESIAMRTYQHSAFVRVLCRIRTKAIQVLLYYKTYYILYRNTVVLIVRRRSAIRRHPAAQSLACAALHRGAFCAEVTLESYP